jgi:hypothetical protein
MVLEIIIIIIIIIMCDEDKYPSVWHSPVKAGKLSRL